MSCGEIMTIVIASITLLVTTITLFWFMRDRQKQNKKEFEDLIYNKIKKITVLMIDIAKIKETKTFVDLNDIKEAEKEFTSGFTYLDIYGNTHKFPYLSEFAVINSKNRKINNVSFSIPHNQQ